MPISRTSSPSFMSSASAFMSWMLCHRWNRLEAFCFVERRRLRGFCSTAKLVALAISPSSEIHTPCHPPGHQTRYWLAALWLNAHIDRVVVEIIVARRGGWFFL